MGTALERPRRRSKSAFAVLLIVLASVLAPLGVLSVWVKSQLTDTDRYLATVAPLAHDPAVRSAVTNLTTDQIMKYLPIDSLLNGLAPDDQSLLNGLLGQLGGALNDGLTGFVRGQVAQVVDSDAFAAVWVAVNRTAHASLDKALTGQGGGAVRISGDTVTLDLAPLIDQVKTGLVAGGLPLAAQIPEVHTDFVLVSSDTVGSVRLWFRLLDLAGFWLPVITLALALAGVLLARRRRRAVIGAALGIAGGAAVLGIGVDVFRAFYLDGLTAGVDQAAAGAIYDALARFLRSSVRTVVVLGVLVALGAWLTGRGRQARTVRGLWQAGLGAVRQAAERLGLRLGAVGRFTHRFKAWLGWAAVLVAVVVLLLRGYPTAGTVLWLAVALLVVLAVLEFLDEPGEAVGGYGSGRGEGDGDGDGQGPSDGQPPSSAGTSPTRYA
ncbi:hypothetical protein OG455_22125 [Kitasatospora sp. NBC_01287]|uniref:hypothetical protein n=1 Tax=Kitasatospora sp. NBC_01287 TaxID=2903573 RepID=UPI00225280DB|nr:hypothetical protein [Kitasatospora sp. NBC_01287]MCX4748176.1 hypothetical protein [Kitasatospora sp. NBC_01287]